VHQVGYLIEINTRCTVNKTLKIRFIVQHFVWREEIFKKLLLLIECVSLFGILSIAALMGDPEDTEFLSDKLAVFSKTIYESACRLHPSVHWRTR
jgi:hypothetical protein